VASVSAKEVAYDPETMWRGPTWVNVNYLLIEALQSAAQGNLARALCDRTLDLVAGQLDMVEYYNPETGGAAASAARGFSWSASLFLDLLLRRFGGDLADAPRAGDRVPI